MSEGQSLRGLHLFLKEDILLLLEAISFSISIFNFHGVHKPSFFRALVNAPITAPIVTPAAKTMAVTANPYFFKISVSHSRSGSFSRSFSYCSSRAATFCLSSSTFHVLSPLFRLVISIVCNIFICPYFCIAPVDSFLILGNTPMS